jgi:hypothetical protein
MCAERKTTVDAAWLNNESMKETSKASHQGVGAYDMMQRINTTPGQQSLYYLPRLTGLYFIICLAEKKKGDLLPCQAGFFRCKDISTGDIFQLLRSNFLLTLLHLVVQSLSSVKWWELCKCLQSEIRTPFSDFIGLLPPNVSHCTALPLYNVPTRRICSKSCPFVASLWLVVNCNEHG